ncbi:MAG: hypothetical protein MJ228_00450 [Bacilli bacterium]|nr:hypothetical protein [Bacilli bacterium]
MNKARLEKLLFVISSSLTAVVSCGICLYAGLNYKEKDSVSFEIDQDNKTFYLKKKVSFEKGDFIKYSELNSNFIAEENMFCSFDGISATGLQIGSQFKKGDTIGKRGSQNVVADDDGIVLNIKNSQSEIEIDCYLFEKFTIQVELTSYDFYSGDYRSKELFADFDGNKKALFFDSYDYSKVEYYGLFLVNYRCHTKDLIVTDRSFRGVFTGDDYYNHAVYTKDVFSKANESHSFVYKGPEEKWVLFSLYCKEIIDFCEIVDTRFLDFDLFSVGDIYEVD